MQIKINFLLIENLSGNFRFIFYYVYQGFTIKLHAQCVCMKFSKYTMRKNSATFYFIYCCLLYLHTAYTNLQTYTSLTFMFLFVFIAFFTLPISFYSFSFLLCIFRSYYLFKFPLEMEMKCNCMLFNYYFTTSTTIIIIFISILSLLPRC